MHAIQSDPRRNGGLSALHTRHLWTLSLYAQGKQQNTVGFPRAGDEKHESCKCFKQNTLQACNNRQRKQTDFIIRMYQCCRTSRSGTIRCQRHKPNTRRDVVGGYTWEREKHRETKHEKREQSSICTRTRWRYQSPPAPHRERVRERNWLLCGWTSGGSGWVFVPSQLDLSNVGGGWRVEGGRESVKEREKERDWTGK